MLPKYYIYSNTQTCPPCRELKRQLDEKFPEWVNYINYVDIYNMTSKDIFHITKINVRGLPSFTSESDVISVGYSPAILNKIIELCTSE